MNSIPLNVTESVRRRNPHLYTVGVFPALDIPAPEAGKRMRQNSKPLMNKLEAEFLSRILATTAFTRQEIRVQAVTFRLANSLRYTPDFFIIGCLGLICYEVKGKWVDGDSFPKLKMAASVFPEISWRLVWKSDGIWKEQIVLA